jgi:hypothetical protein
MDVFLSMRSGASSEAATFGLRPIFLSAVARELFPRLFESGKAEVIEDMAALEERLREMPREKKAHLGQPDLPGVLARLDVIAAEYSELCRRSSVAS